MSIPAGGKEAVEGLMSDFSWFLQTAESIGLRGEPTARGGELRGLAQDMFSQLSTVHALFAAHGDPEADAIAVDLAEARDFAELVAAASDSPVSVSAAAWDRGVRWSNVA